jgi:hypothetical protein
MKSIIDLFIHTTKYGKLRGNVPSVSVIIIQLFKKQEVSDGGRNRKLWYVMLQLVT